MSWHRFWLEIDAACRAARVHNAIAAFKPKENWRRKRKLYGEDVA